MTAAMLETPSGRKIAYHRTPGIGPGIVFLGGFKSDMDGTKAVHLEAWCKEHGRAFLRFDYSGHGQSSGVFEEGCIGDWAQDAQAAISMLTAGPQVLIGSSMGGWISLLVVKSMPETVAALVTIAAAPDFTEDGYWNGFDDNQRAELEATGKVAMPSDYDEPYIITKRLIEEGRKTLVLRDPLPLNLPVRFLQGTEDEDVPLERAMALLNHATGDDIRLLLVKGVDHRFSDPSALLIIEDAVENVLDALSKV